MSVDLQQKANLQPESLPTAQPASETWSAWWTRCQTDSSVPAIAALHLLALVNLAIAQPLYNLIGLEPMVLVVHRARPVEIVLLAVGLSLLLPLALSLVLLGVGRISRRLGRALFLLAVLTLLFAVALPAWKRVIVLPGVWLVGLAVVTAALGTWAYWRFAAMRLLTGYAAFGAVLFPCLFLFRAPGMLLVFPADAKPVVAGRVEKPAPVVMLVLDEFSMAALLNAQRQIDAEKFPNFSRLAEGSTWYRNATSMSGYTQYAIPALLTGRRPRAVPASFAGFPENLFTLLDNQYELTVFEPYTTLCPVEVDPTAIRHTPGRRMNRLSADLARIYVQFLTPFDLAATTGVRHAREYTKFTFERQREKTQGLIRYGWAKNRAEQFEHFLEVIQPAAERPPLYFAHLVLPHVPYEYLPSGRRHGSRVDAEGNRWSKDSWHVAQQQQHYLLQAAYVDRMLGRLLDRLKETELYDDCLLVVTADHGVTFRPGHHTRDATAESAPDIMWIPLFIKAPRQTTPSVSDRNVETIDVLPTMVDMLHGTDCWPMEGVSAADPEQPPRPTKSFYRTAETTLQFSGDFPEKNSTLSQQVQWFAVKGDVSCLYRFGAHKELVGQSLRRQFISRRAKYHVEIDDSAALTGVTQQTDPWPCFLAGSVDSEAVQRGPISLAVAVNGQIEAVTRTYRTEQGKIQWQALVREEAIQEGDNTVRIYIIRRFGSRIMLEPTRREQ